MKIRGQVGPYNLSGLVLPTGEVKLHDWPKLDDQNHADLDRVVEVLRARGAPLDAGGGGEDGRGRDARH